MAEKSGATRSLTGSVLGRRKLLGAVLCELYGLSESDLREAMLIKQRENVLIGEALVRMGVIDEEKIARALAQAHDLSYVDLDEITIEPAVAGLIPVPIVRRYMIVPFEQQDGKLFAAVDRPPERSVLRTVEQVSRTNLQLHITSSSKLNDAITRLYEKDMPGMREDSSAVEIVNALLTRAVRMKASDIHIEPLESRLRVRLRVDGVLQEVESLGLEKINAITARIKVMAGMNVSERRTPQDGAFVFQEGRQPLDVRVSTLPSIYGEKTVMRILQGKGARIALSDIGMNDSVIARFEELIRRPYGILLIVGPTGSGKSTTLTGAIQVINHPGVNITTIEEPVEYKIDGITQVHVDGSEKIAFASALRSILRQDPDVIMVGEVRDSLTAETALRAALTGHLVFTTLHTNDAPSSLPRLIDMGCERFLVSSAVAGVLAQRLVRKLCPRCREAYEPDAARIKQLGVDPARITGPWYRKKGCPFCYGSGYKGRVGIFELMVVDEKIRSAIMTDEPAEKMRAMARTAGMQTLREDGIDKVLSGVTTVDEVLRMTIKD